MEKWHVKNPDKSGAGEVKGLKNKIRGLMDIMCGENFSMHSESFTHAVVVLAKDKKALEDYRSHPDHKIVADKIEKMEERGIGIDFESK